MTYFTERIWNPDGSGNVEVEGNLTMDAPYYIKQGADAPITHAYNGAGYGGLAYLFEDDSHQLTLEILSDVVRLGAKTDSAVAILQNNVAAIEINTAGNTNIVGTLSIGGVLVSTSGIFPPQLNIGYPVTTDISLITEPLNVLTSAAIFGEEIEGVLKLGSIGGTATAPLFTPAGTLGSIYFLDRTETVLRTYGRIRLVSDLGGDDPLLAGRILFDLPDESAVLAEGAFMISAYVETVPILAIQTLTQDFIVLGTGAVGCYVGNPGNPIVQVTTNGLGGWKLGFFGEEGVTQPVLATGAGATVDNVITMLQNLGLCSQA